MNCTPLAFTNVADRVNVKICGINTAESLEATITADADMAGFMFFARSPRHLQLDQARKLGAQARGRIEKVAVVVDADNAAIADIVEALKPDLLQLHGHESAERIASVRQRFGVPVMKVFGVSTKADIAEAMVGGAGADRLLFDAKAPKGAVLPGGNGVVFDWSLLTGLQVRQPWLLSGGLTVANVAQAVAATGAPGIDVSSGVESAPGIKDVDLIAHFVAHARLCVALPRL